MKIRSRLEADYRSESIAALLSPLRISIVSQVYHDQALSVEEIAAIENRLIELLQSPVPTATARDFEGSLPFTATPTVTNTPTTTSTSTPTSTSTRTPLPPTRTPTKTKTEPPPKPTKKPETPTITLTPSDTPTPTLSPTPIVDLDDPAVHLISILGERDGVECKLTIAFGVQDPAPSLGVEDSNVKLKFEYPKGSGNNLYPPLTGGGSWQGVPGTRWDGSYSGTQSGLSPDSEIKAWVKVTDNAGHSITALGVVLKINEIEDDSDDCKALQQ